MKKYFVMLAMLAYIGTILAQEKIIAYDIEVVQGGHGLLTIDMQLLADHNYVSYQLKVELPDGISLVADAYGNAAFTLSENQPTAVFKITDFPASNGILKVASSPSTAIAAHEGTLVTIPVQADEGLPVGTKLTGSISGVVFAHADATAQNFSDATFNIEVVEKVTVLDEASTTMPEVAENVDVHVLRTINANEWSTICLPFAMTAAQVKTTFGDDVQLGDFNGYETTEDGEGNVIGITVNFNDATEMEANHPYIIKVSNTITEFSVNDVNIDPEEKPTVAAVKRTKKQWSEMIGTYVANTALEATTLFLSGNKFWYSFGKTKMKAFRAYFDFYDVLTEVEDAYSSRIFMFFEDNKTTGIKDMRSKADDVRNNIFDLQGRRVMKPVKGLYIKNGRKEVVK